MMLEESRKAHLSSEDSTFFNVHRSILGALWLEIYEGDFD